MTEKIKREKREQTKGEEIFNGVSHMVGAVFGIVVLVIMVVFAAIEKDTYAIVAAAIYGVSIIIACLCSCIYHMLRTNRAKKVFRVLDHCSIFVLIAGTYTPFCLVTLRNEGAWGWTLFGIIWGIAILGIILNGISMHNKVIKIASQIMYLAMGWMCVIAIVPIVQELTTWGLVWLAAGGIAYTVGVPFYVMGRYRKNFHCYWHVFVALGILLHYIAIQWYVIL